MSTKVKLIHFLEKKPLSALLLYLSFVFLWSVVMPRDYATWILEFFPLFIGIVVLILTSKSFPLTSFSYGVISIGATLMLIGAHYTYPHVPLFEWMKDDFGFERNNYDKVGHFFQGFITAVIVREVFVRKNIISSIQWNAIMAITFSIALSAIWELLEWFGFSVFMYFSLAQSASEFLGTQGYIWDAQSDILFASIGAIIAIVFFRKYHDKKIKNFIKV